MTDSRDSTNFDDIYAVIKFAIKEDYRIEYYNWYREYFLDYAGNFAS